MLRCTNIVNSTQDTEIRENISFDQFLNVDLRVGKVLEATIPEGSEKLIRLVVDFGREQRTIFTGLKSWYEPDFFKGRLFVFVYNLEAKKMLGEKSQGMLLAVHVEDSENPTESKPLPVEAPPGSVSGQNLT